MALAGLVATPRVARIPAAEPTLTQSVPQAEHIRLTADLALVRETPMGCRADLVAAFGVRVLPVVLVEARIVMVWKVKLAPITPALVAVVLPAVTTPTPSRAERLTTVRLANHQPRPAPDLVPSIHTFTFVAVDRACKTRLDQQLALVDAATEVVRRFILAVVVVIMLLVHMQHLTLVVHLVVARSI